ncbi:MAG: hypothetical protein AAF628_10880 [Planctomycetota bacterium]
MTEGATTEGEPGVRRRARALLRRRRGEPRPTDITRLAFVMLNGLFLLGQVFALGVFESSDPSGLQYLGLVLTA